MKNSGPPALPGPIPPSPPSYQSVGEEALSFDQIAGWISRNILFMTAWMILGGGLGYAASYVVPQKYKTIAIFNLQNTYFQIPMVNDLGNTDPTEVQPQKLALLGLAINDEFIEKIGTQYHLFTHDANDPGHAVERDSLKKEIEAFPINANTYQIAAVAGDPKTSLAISEDSVNRIIDTLTGERRKLMQRYRDSIQVQLDSLGSSSSHSTSAPVHALSPEESELATLESRIRTLEAQYTPEHPSVLALKAQRDQLREVIKNGGGHRPKVASAANEGGSRRDSKEDLRQDLVRKINYLDIALKLEENRLDLPYFNVIEKPTLPLKPVSPKKRDFAFGGLALGLFVSMALAVVRERKIGAPMIEPGVAAQSLGVAFLGELPVLRQPDIVVGRRS